MKTREVRKIFLDFFEGKGHTLVPSSSVIPHGDRTLLFTNAGMNQFKDIFTGRQEAKFPRATTAQKCIRAGGKHNDLDNVGYTTRHLTFFEMLGNFSFGDYFKKEAIRLSWELVTEGFGIPPDRLWITVYRDDDEARDLWREVPGLAADRIVGLGAKDNYWSMGEIGPCGPCSEILLDRGEAFGAADLENGERFFEFWNLVFMQFDQKADGTKVPLPHPSIDTGMGLERLAMVLQGVDSVFETDMFRGLISRVEKITGGRYDPGPEGVPYRVIADHMRCLVFALADGAEPSNEGRGYVLRRILRRAARYGSKIYTKGPLLHLLVDDIVREMGDAYSEIRERSEYITRLIQNEEERFGETLESGIQLFDSVVEKLRQQGTKTIPGAEVFKLYDTFGFPADLVEQMSEEIGFEVDLEGFQKSMEEQRTRSRGTGKFSVQEAGAEDLAVETLPETEFVGYEWKEADAEIQAAAEREGMWRVVLSKTPFYGESGGQVGDHGRIQGDDFVLTVEDTRKERGRFVHYCTLQDGDSERVRSGTVVHAAIDASRRDSIERNHTATHLLHAALRNVVGTHVHQKGSLVEPARLRFDVTHFSGFTADELERAEGMVREHVLSNVPVETFETDYEDAVKSGAMALFGEKYGDRVRVVKIGDFSVELCGGTHVDRTGDIGAFLVASEGSVSAGVRRLEALTALGADDLHRRNQGIVAELSRILKVAPDNLIDRLQRLLEENRGRKAKPKSERSPATAAEGSGVRREKIGKALFLTASYSGEGVETLREAYDRIKKESEELVAVFFSPGGGKLKVLVAVSTALVQKGVDAREIFKAGAAQMGAKGGGRPEMVQGSGTEPGGMEAALEDMLSAVKGKLGGGA
jgi:alanyl-tRNA synthetase